MEVQQSGCCTIVFSLGSETQNTDFLLILVLPSDCAGEGEGGEGAASCTIVSLGSDAHRAPVFQCPMAALFPNGVPLPYDHAKRFFRVRRERMEGRQETKGGRALPWTHVRPIYLFVKTRKMFIFGHSGVHTIACVFHMLDTHSLLIAYHVHMLPLATLCS